MSPTRCAPRKDLRTLPPSWRRYFVPQGQADYSRAAHATWRRLVERTAELVHDLNPWLHPCYVQGFRRLILPWSKIPSLDAIGEALAALGWSIACVDGYLPADVYAGLLANNVFPVSRRMRRPEHVDFSPMPDLAHDLIGHIPMLVSSTHGQFLRGLAQAMANAKGNAQDQRLYLANRACAGLRCRRSRPPRAMAAAEHDVELARRALDRRPSLLTRLGRLYLWTIEFGLIGTPTEFRIYGAGLLSSPAETRSLCLGHTPIRPLSLAATRRDIHFSDLQSVYFVAPDYASLNRILRAVQGRRSAAQHSGGAAVE